MEIKWETRQPVPILAAQVDFGKVASYQNVLYMRIIPHDGRQIEFVRLRDGRQVAFSGLEEMHIVRGKFLVEGLNGQGASA